MADDGELRWYGCGDAACLEFARFADEVLVRDSDRPEGPYLTVPRESWSAFIGAVRAGEFDLSGSV